MALDNGKLLSLNWSAHRYMKAETGMPDLLFAKTVDEARKHAQNFDASITLAFADSSGNIGHQSTGIVPLREDGTLPYAPGAWLRNEQCFDM